MRTPLIHVGRYVIALLSLCSVAFFMTACWPFVDASSTANSSAPVQTNQSSSSSTSSGSSTTHPVMTVTVKEKHGTSGDVYMFDPASITVKKGDTVAFKNLSDELQDIDVGDASKAGIDVKVPVNETALATFNVPGTFTLKSEKGATITVTVN
jgi:plastocyanin